MGLVVEDEVVQPAPLDRHQHDPVRRVDRGEDARSPCGEPEPVLRAGPGADAAAEAEVRLRRGALAAGVGGVVARLEPQRPDRAGLDALAAPVARRPVQLHHEVRGLDRVQEAEASRREHGLAAAAAAVAHEGRFLAHVLAELHEAPLLGLVQQLQALGGGGLPRVAVLRERARRAAEGEADVAGRVAGAAHVLHLVPAVAQADRDRGRLPDHVARPLVVEHLQRELRGNGPLLHERAPEPRLPAHEEVLDEVLLDVQVLEVELREPLLVDVPPHPHHRELEEAGHGGRQDVERLAVLLEVEEDRAGGEALEHVRGLGERHAPGLRRGRRAEGLDGQPGDELRLPRAEEDLEDPVETLRGRRALREAVQPVHQPAVALACGEVAHETTLRPPVAAGMMHSDQPAQLGFFLEGASLLTAHGLSVLSERERFP